MRAVVRRKQCWAKKEGKNIDVKFFFRRWGNLMMVTTTIFVCVRDEFIHCDAIGKSASTVGTKKEKKTQIFLQREEQLQTLKVDETVLGKYDTSRGSYYF